MILIFTAGIWFFFGVTLGYNFDFCHIRHQLLLFVLQGRCLCETKLNICLLPYYRPRSENYMDVCL